MKENIMTAFSDLGFKLEEEGENCYRFKYEGYDLLYFHNENDEEFFDIAMPDILSIEEGEMLKACALMEKVNSTLKYVKAYVNGNSVWLFYERELFGEENLKELISRIILHLENAHDFARRAMEEIEQIVAENDSDDAEAEEIAEETGDNDNDDNE